MMMEIHVPLYAVFNDKDAAIAFAERKQAQGYGVMANGFQTDVCLDKVNVYRMERFKVIYSRHFKMEQAANV